MAAELGAELADKAKELDRYMSFEGGSMPNSWLLGYGKKDDGNE